MGFIVYNFKAYFVTFLQNGLNIQEKDYLFHFIYF